MSDTGPATLVRFDKLRGSAYLTMANISPFRAYRYTAAAGAGLSQLVTQPYDKISPAMRERYLDQSPYNLVRVILGKPAGGDSESDNVYTRASRHFNDWIGQGVLVQDDAPGFYPYFQEFADPDSGETLTRKGFIALGGVEPYETGVVHRHERTLAGPKKDRLSVLRHTQAHFGQIFMLYQDPATLVDDLLDEVAATPPLGEVRDEYGAVHRLWRVTDPQRVSRIRELMADKKLIIADGHHRYETALQYQQESPLDDARRVMMTLVNMCSPGLKILATHRVLRQLDRFSSVELLTGLAQLGQISLQPRREFRAELIRPAGNDLMMGVALPGQEQIHVLRTPRQKGDLDVRFLHERILGGVLGINEEAVREEKFLQYVRGVDTAIQEVDNRGAQAAFLLQPTRIEDVAEVSLSGGVMPQKSTDFYPKLLTGMTIYRLER